MTRQAWEELWAKLDKQPPRPPPNRPRYLTPGLPEACLSDWEVQAMEDAASPRR